MKHSKATEHRPRACKGHAATPGTGPQGETCNTCAHAVKRKSGKGYYKCALMQAHWTGGKATNVLLRWLACRHWEKKQICEGRSSKERFEEKFRVTPGCWVWTANKISGGYGMMRVNKKQTLAHRISYELYVGPIPDGLVIRHRCDNPSCVNPDHLLPGTHMDNMRDRDERGRNIAYKGSKNGASKLAEDEVLKIRADNRTQKAIAADYGVSTTQISYIQNRKAWVHL